MMLFFKILFHREPSERMPNQILLCFLGLLTLGGNIVAQSGFAGVRDLAGIQGAYVRSGSGAPGTRSTTFGDFAVADAGRRDARLINRDSGMTGTGTMDFSFGMLGGDQAGGAADLNIVGTPKRDGRIVPGSSTHTTGLLDMGVTGTIDAGLSMDSSTGMDAGSTMDAGGQGVVLDRGTNHGQDSMSQSFGMEEANRAVNVHPRRNHDHSESKNYINGP